MDQGEQMDPVKELLDAISKLCPLYSNGFLDTHINRVLRQQLLHVLNLLNCIILLQVYDDGAVKDSRNEP